MTTEEKTFRLNSILAIVAGREMRTLWPLGVVFLAYLGLIALIG